MIRNIVWFNLVDISTIQQFGRLLRLFMTAFGIIIRQIKERMIVLHKKNTGVTMIMKRKVKVQFD